MTNLKPNNNAVGQRIKDLRLSKGLTLEDFGKLFNTGKVTVYNWEIGRNLPNKANIKKIADLGGISVNELLYGSLNEFVSNVLQENFDFSSEPYLLNHAVNMVLTWWNSSDYPTERDVINTYNSIKSKNENDAIKSAYEIAYYSNQIKLNLNDLVDISKKLGNLTQEQRNLISNAQKNNENLQLRYNKYFGTEIEYAIEDLEELNNDK